MNSTSKSFRELIVWQKAHQFVLKTYEFTRKFPKEEIYSLTSQFRKAAISIASNIAEGYKKKSKADKLRFYNIAEGSLSECQYYCILAQDLNYGNTNELINLSFEIENYWFPIVTLFKNLNNSFFQRLSSIYHLLSSKK